MIRISGYIINLALILAVLPVWAQTGQPDYTPDGTADTLAAGPGNNRGAVQEDPEAALIAFQQDTSVVVLPVIPEGYFPGLRIGVNISRPLWTFSEPSRFGFEGVADLNVGYEYFAVAEAGFAIRDLKEPTYHLKESGMYLRIGGDRNFYKQFNDVLAVGARLGFAIYERSAPAISVEPGYWGEYSGSLSGETFFRPWAEVVAVLKTEIFTNVFMGWSLRGKMLLFDKADRHLQERYIPGFGSSKVRSAAGFDFYLYYRIPTAK